MSRTAQNTAHFFKFRRGRGISGTHKMSRILGRAAPVVRFPLSYGKSTDSVWCSAPCKREQFQYFVSTI